LPALGMKKELISVREDDLGRIEKRLYEKEDNEIDMILRMAD
jgi:hypothetical protein